MMKMMILKVEMMMIVKMIIIKETKDLKYAVKRRARRKIMRTPVNVLSPNSPLQRVPSLPYTKSTKQQNTSEPATKRIKPQNDHHKKFKLQNVHSTQRPMLCNFPNTRYANLQNVPGRSLLIISKSKLN
jgi:hypothetical protein